MSKEVNAITSIMLSSFTAHLGLAFNTIIDMYLAGISAFELWQFFIQTLQRNPSVSVWAQFSKINPNVRSRRIWQTLTLSGPLVLSGAASIVKTYVCVLSAEIRNMLTMTQLLQSLGDRLDFTYNIVTFILWVKIENYGILIATCAPVIRLFLRTFVDMRREGRYGGYPWSRSHSSNPHNSNENSSSSGQQEIEMKRGNKFQQRFNLSRTDGSRVDPDKTFDSLFDDSYLLNTVDDESKHVPSAAGPSHTINLVARMPSPVNSRDTRHSTGVGVTVKTDIVVEVDEELGMSRGSESSSQSKDGHLYPTFTLQDDQSWVERHASAYVWKTSNQ
ncbi:hypothetical protein PMAA_060860 [Talaromyces marneffei ATCC 18224]|uniref:Integral membrane protein n=1 Tax=Talaromyces marneffei (strain ATCC 18224 / CBS 334.59 / QM 7333) TaxID=441960 RepID=B6QMT8_TALMQ|nr:hypothetical protein PMAA_060860 [Talaromyces marneffei ATCC 18224]